LYKKIRRKLKIEIKINFELEQGYIKGNDLFMRGHATRWPFSLSSMSFLRVIFDKCLRRWS